MTDRGAWVIAVYRATRPELVRMLRTRLSEAEDVEDVLQETFVALWRSLEKGRDLNESNVRDFLRTVASGLASGWRRGARRWNDRIQAGAVPELVSSADPAVAVEADEFRARVDRAFDDALASARLTERQRAIVFARYRSGLSFLEIARELRISRDTVWRDHGKAIEHIRTAFRLAGIDET
jgi:RNA polymerase sigma-70 factor (ECF subfamily)